MQASLIIDGSEILAGPVVAKSLSALSVVRTDIHFDPNYIYNGLGTGGLDDISQVSCRGNPAAINGHLRRPVLKNRGHLTKAKISRHQP